LHQYILKEARRWTILAAGLLEVLGGKKKSIIKSFDVK